MMLENDEKWVKFQNAFLLSWANVPRDGFENVDLVFDIDIDIDSLEEFLQEIETELHVRFELDLGLYFPGWLSPFSIFHPFEKDSFLGRLRPKYFETLTPKKIWRSQIGP